MKQHTEPTIQNFKIENQKWCPSIYKKLPTIKQKQLYIIKISPSVYMRLAPAFMMQVFSSSQTLIACTQHDGNIRVLVINIHVVLFGQFNWTCMLLRLKSIISLWMKWKFFQLDLQSELSSWIFIYLFVYSFIHSFISFFF